MHFTRAELVQATGGAFENFEGDGVSCLVIDSRDVPKDALFVAIKGDRHDGHSFAPSAIENGAALALVSKDKSAELGSIPKLIVEDPLEGMRALAAFARARSKAKIIGITGSVGKTSTKEAVRTILEHFGKTHASIKSYNNHWGVPLMVANLPVDAQFGVFEMGMNHSGEITPLTHLVRPHVALITSIAPAHIGELGSMQAIAAAKAEIFSGLEAGGKVVMNVDHDFASFLTQEAEHAGAQEIATYGLAPSNFSLTDISLTDSSGAASALIDENIYRLSLDVAGQHLLVNGLGAVLVARALGLDVGQAVEALGQFAAPQGRGEVHSLGDAQNPLKLIDESYNANPASMKAALNVFAQVTCVGKKVLFLGDMRELGEMSQDLHASLFASIEAAAPDYVGLVGAEMKILAPELSQVGIEHGLFENVDEAIQVAPERLAYGDAVMLKGSLGIGLGKLVSFLRKHFA